MDASSFPGPTGTTPSVGELSAAFAKHKRAKSPPLAFEKTSNDSLAPLASSHQDSYSSGGGIGQATDMGRHGPSQTNVDAQDLQVVVDQQASAIQLLHGAFEAERKSWNLERDRLYLRIAKLEKLLKTGDGYSPAKSPILSPFSGSNFTSPQSKATANSNRLPSIAEDENIQPLSSRREGAPQSIDIPTTQSDNNGRKGSVSFAKDEDTPTALKVDEISVSPPADAGNLSPPPYNYRMEAGHTPLKAPRQPTPPPQNVFAMDGIDDAPTRNNTEINIQLTESRDEDNELTGPLNMPELPSQPDETNFTLDALSKRLEQLEKHPEESTPNVFREQSPGLASPAEREEELSPKTTAPKYDDNPIAPATTLNREQSASASGHNSNMLSPLSKEASREEEVQADFESGGIKLKKKASVNFGAPFGQLGGWRKQS